VEVLAVLALISCGLGAGLPVMTHGVDARRTEDAAAFLAGQFRLARQRAVMSGQSVAVVFDDVAGEVGWRVCRDHDRDGVSRSDITDGVDRCDSAPQILSSQFAHVRVGYVPGVPGLDGEPQPAPLRFGVARMAVFSPSGTSSSGSIVVRGAGTAQSAVRVSGVTGRTRALRFDTGRQDWVE
jgi:type II secretory pathway pseudopilin PulG